MYITTHQWLELNKEGKGKWNEEYYSFTSSERCTDDSKTMRNEPAKDNRTGQNNRTASL